MYPQLVGRRRKRGNDLPDTMSMKKGGDGNRNLIEAAASLLEKVGCAGVGGDAGGRVVHPADG